MTSVRVVPNDLDRRISPQYVELQRELHSRPNGYGGKGHKWADTVVALLKTFDAWSVLDYGCGKGSLIHRLAELGVGVRLEEYDPAVTGKDQHPSGFSDLVTITDVLEHVEPEHLDAVLAHLKMLARKAVFFVVALDEANKTLEDGRNAHLILQPREWWADRVVKAGFKLLPWQDDWPLPFQYNAHPEKQSKRWIAVGRPC